MGLPRHGDARLPFIAAVHRGARIGMRLEDRQIDEISGVEDLLGDEFGLVVFPIGIGHALHPVRLLEFPVIAVLGILRLAGHRRFLLHETDVGKLAPDFRENVGRNAAARVVNYDVLRPHAALIHELAHHREHHLRRGINEVVRLGAIEIVVAVDFDGYDLARLITAPGHLARVPVVILEDRAPCLRAVRGAGQPRQGGGE